MSVYFETAFACAQETVRAVDQQHLQAVDDVLKFGVGETLGFRVFRDGNQVPSKQEATPAALTA